jgi:proton-dependent oligopeptide transporter, POT family
LLFETFRLDTIARHRMSVVLTLTCISLLFWAFFEQAGSSMTNFADRNVDRVFDRATLSTIVKADIGKTMRLQPTQEQVGYHNGDRLFTLDVLNKLREDFRKSSDLQREEAKEASKKTEKSELTIDWKVAPDNVGMNIAHRNDEIPASTLQSANPIYIMLMGLAFTALWTFLNSHRMEPSAPMKFAMAFLPLALGFAALWYGARTADTRGMVAAGWLLLAYLLHTIGELCLSPVGLSMVVKLSPARLASTVIGGWFLASAVGRFFSGIIAQFTNVGAGGAIPPPKETVNIYGDVFGIIAIASGVTAVLCFCLVPLLKRWMHEGEP